MALVLCAGTVGPAGAQNHEDILRFSRYNYSFGTARSAAMGGAFSSLGADLSSVTMNPAGLGMYRSSEISISPSFTSLGIESTYRDDGGTFTNKGTKNKFALNNIGGAFNLYNGSGGVTSVTFGFAYSKLADMNGELYTTGRANRTASSMLDMFTEQLTVNNINPDYIGGYLDNGQNFPIYGAMMAYDAYLMDYDADNGWYHLNNHLSTGSTVNSQFGKYTKGSVGQYDLSLGMNISNQLYLGFGFGIQDIYYREMTDYYESYDNNTAPDPTRISNFTYTQTLKQDGSAWNFKVGAIIRPVEALRIGLAFHTPTYISMDEVYYSDMYGNFAGTVPGLNGSSSHSESVAFQNSYNMRTPMRFIGGLSYNFFNTATVSVDYERVWYNQMKMFNSGFDREDTEVTGLVKEWYKPANNVRVGVEALVAPNVFARVGYAFYDTMYKMSELKDYGKYSNYSAGFGYRTGSWGLDLAYIYMDTKQAPAYIFYYMAADGYNPRSGVFDTKDTRHNVTLTASLRF